MELRRLNKHATTWQLGAHDPDAGMQQQEKLKLLAYQFWQERGSPFGTPEVDWFRTENEVRPRMANLEEESPLVAAAKTVGSVLGSVAGLVATVTGRTAKDTALCQ
jgi:Protein of unknown function (DUF2934)